MYCFPPLILLFCLYFNIHYQVSSKILKNRGYIFYYIWKIIQMIWNSLDVLSSEICTCFSTLLVLKAIFEKSAVILIFSSIFGFLIIQPGYGFFLTGLFQNPVSHSSFTNPYSIWLLIFRFKSVFTSEKFPCTIDLIVYLMAFF